MDHRRLYGGSADAPEYLQTSRSTFQKSPIPQRSLKGIKSLLHTSVSNEAPDVFHVKYASVITSESRKGLLEKRDIPPQIEAAKTNLREGHRKFVYQDYGEHAGQMIDQNSVKPTTFIDLLVGKNTGKMYRLPYYQEYYSVLNSTGFAHHPGEISASAGHKDLIRSDSGLLHSVQVSLNQTKTSKRHENQSTKSVSPIPAEEKTKKMMEKKTKRRGPSEEAKMAQVEIEEFEGRLKRELKLPPVHRTCQEKWRWIE